MSMTRFSVLRSAFLVLVCVATSGLCSATAAETPIITVSGGITLNGAFQPLLFTWNTAVTVQGSGWQPGETVTIILRGPLNSLAVGASPLSLGPLSADANGNFSASVPIPFDSGIVGPSARIPQPGHYQVQAFGSASGLITGPQEIDLSAATFVLAAGFDWGHERGGRDGVLPGLLHDFSPERS